MEPDIITQLAEEQQRIIDTLDLAFDDASEAADLAFARYKPLDDRLQRIITARRAAIAALNALLSGQPPAAPEDMII